MKAFQQLTADELSEFYLVPVWVSILIAGADNKIEKHELSRALKIMEEKKSSKDKPVIEFYKMASEKFEVNLKGYITLLPQNETQRFDFLLEKLSRVNYFFSKLDTELAHQLYLSFRDFANKIAQASGGLFGLLSISFAESKYIDLKMISDPAEINN